MAACVSGKLVPLVLMLYLALKMPFDFLKLTGPCRFFFFIRLFKTSCPSCQQSRASLTGSKKFRMMNLLLSLSETSSLISATKMEADMADLLLGWQLSVWRCGNT